MITIPFDDFNRKSNILDFNQRKKKPDFLKPPFLNMKIKNSFTCNHSLYVYS